MIWDVDSYIVHESGPVAVAPYREWFMVPLVSDARLDLLNARHERRKAYQRVYDAGLRERRRNDRAQG